MSSLLFCCAARRQDSDVENIDLSKPGATHKDLTDSESLKRLIQTHTSSFCSAVSEDEIDCDQVLPIIRAVSRQMSAFSTTVQMPSQRPFPFDTTSKPFDPSTEVDVGRATFNGEANRGDADSQMEVLRATKAMLPNGEFTTWQRQWCTSDNVQRYIVARKGDITKSAEILRLTLVWREAYKDVLSGSRIPLWTGDMRVLTRSQNGHPLVYLCMANQVRFAASSNAIDHMAAVLEAAVKALRNDATTFDFVFDSYGFRISSNLDPRPTIALMEMLKQPFRDRLRNGYIVDAPKAFAILWNIARPHMPKATADKIKFLSSSKLSQELCQAAGSDVSRIVNDVILANRAARPTSWKQPSELAD